jgi:ubiquinone/menaquinone biosynthesis C-methylase UbiE
MLPLNRQNRYRERFRREHPHWRASGDEFEALTRQRLGANSRVLDVGCGRGGVMELLWRQVGSAVGVDPDLASLREHRAGLPLVCARGEAAPFAGERFDVVLALWVLEHVAQPEVLLREVRRVLAPGGRFLFLTPNANHPLLMANRFSWAFPAVQKLLVPRLYGRSEADTFRVRYQANTPARLRQLAAATGFTIDSQRAISDPTYLAFNEPGYRTSVWLESWLPPSWYVHIIGDWVKAG